MEGPWGVEDTCVRDALLGLLSSEHAYFRCYSAEKLREWGVEEVSVRKARFDLFDIPGSPGVSSARVLIERGHARLVVERRANQAAPEPWSALAACHHVIDCKPLTTRELEALVAITALRDTDTEIRGNARVSLRNWLWSRLEAGESAIA